MIEDPFGSSEFGWDDGNSDKNWLRHRVSREECEQIFANGPNGDVARYSGSELRYFALGITNPGRRLFVVFIVREQRVRVISARDMSRQERRNYERERN